MSFDFDFYFLKKINGLNRVEDVVKFYLHVFKQLLGKTISLKSTK